MATTIPESMIPVSALTAPVEVLSTPQLKTDADGKPRENSYCPNRLGYALRVEVVLDFRVKTLATGENYTMPVCRQYPVTVWSDSAVSAEIGEYVYLQNCAAGIYDGNPYVWCEGLISAGDQE